MPRFNLDNYVPVAERLAAAHAEITHIKTAPPVMLTDMVGYVQVSVALQSGHTATGSAHFRLDREGMSAQATSPIEDAETSALGRALAFLGYESTRSIASREEMRVAETRTQAPHAKRAA
jgi:hypothetical protein